MRITTLGELAVDGKAVRGERLGVVVRELVGARGRAVSVAALVDAVWDGSPPDDAPGAVQALVARVRRLGLPVEAVPGGYRLPADAVDVDAVRGRELVDRGRAALGGGDVDAARRAGDAARAEFPEVPDLSDDAVARLFADVAGLRAEAALRSKAAPADEPDLRRLVGLAPPHEPSAALLVRILAAQGRDAEALELVERLRAELAERYGADLSPVVAAAHLALLRGELATKPARAPRRRVWRRGAGKLVGRDGDVAAVADALRSAPLVTVVAAGGAGKTSLAAAVAAVDGRAVYAVELAGLRAAAEILPAVLAATGAADPERPEAWAAPPQQRLLSAVRDLDGVLVLDNCEHLLDGAAALAAEVLAVARGELTVLATSRAPLGLPEEVVYRLRALPDAAALELLETRARAGGAALAIPPDAALELCHRLDNLPLALELAAARLRHMPIEDVLGGLGDRFALLDDALRGLPDRHASLWALVDWSRELLAPEDQDLLERLAVIPAPFTAAAAAGVAGRDSRRGLAALVEQSLLTIAAGEDGQPRYRMLETVREYGETRLADREPAMAGLTGWAAARAVALAADFAGPGQLQGYISCAEEQENLGAALRWAVGHGDDRSAVDVAAALFHLWTVRGLHPEVALWARRLFRADDPVARGRARLDEADPDRLAWVCVLAGLNGFIGDDYRLYSLARRALRRITGGVSHRVAVLAAAMPALSSPDSPASLRVADGMAADGDPYVQGFGLLWRATVHENAGRLDVAAEDAERAYERFEAAGEHWGMGMAAQAIGTRVEWGAGDWLRRSARHMELIGASQDLGSIRVLLDFQLALDGDAEAAHRLAEAAESGARDRPDAAQARLALAQLAWRRQAYPEALAHAAAALRIAEESPAVFPQILAIFRVAVAILHLRMGDDVRATELLRAARDEALASQDMPVLGAWAIGGATLDAYRTGAHTRELWVLGLRLGANVVQLFHGDQGERLTAALGSEDSREPVRSAWRSRPAAEVVERIRVVMDEVLQTLRR
ncbi:BTAD domain-containing putative transcriptional regulator [Dactylosporangium sp. AC04546]|uniref:BTAD domain-containing putative transcriptional regulator n=1 Tax=Dactylosporangium sp. AC04546 TaxID=2862460 RepID=UPI001EDD5AE1|nr:BTAD domain-containing putative transcriptional regulator [Dactylosporangium sp. AC04546]WVK86030.1 BTAD domain-containing putative transcriptional regulator [Dactylosporangium sp. AC04546]